MNISGIGVIQAQLYQQQQSSRKSLEEILLDSYLPSATPYGKESIHLEIELKDGTRMSVDYTWEGMAKKTGYELGRYSGFTYGNEIFSPENTSKRILDFARSLWDGSEEKLDILADAMDKGIGQARNALGTIPGWLSGIIGRTENLVRQGIEDMREELRRAA